MHSGPITLVTGSSAVTGIRTRTYRPSRRARQFFRAPYEALSPAMACRTDLCCMECQIYFAGQVGQGEPFAGPCFCVGEYGGCREALRRAS